MRGARACTARAGRARARAAVARRTSSSGMALLMSSAVERIRRRDRLARSVTQRTSSCASPSCAWRASRAACARLARALRRRASPALRGARRLRGSSTFGSDFGSVLLRAASTAVSARLLDRRLDGACASASTARSRGVNDDFEAVADEADRPRFDGGAFLDQRAEHVAGFALRPVAGHDGGAQARRARLGARRRARLRRAGTDVKRGHVAFA